MNLSIRYKCVINPGYLAVCDEATLLCSVCGNGVVVTIWDKYRKTGGMAHCIYPKVSWREKSTNYHADVAVPSLIKQMFLLSSSPYSLEAQIFGGGEMRGFVEKRASKVIKTVRSVLKKFRITIVSEDTGGALGRKVVFNTNSGDVMVLKTKKVRKVDWAPEYFIGKNKNIF